MLTRHAAAKLCKDFIKRIKTVLASWRHIASGSALINPGDHLQYALFELQCRVQAQLQDYPQIRSDDQQRLNIARFNDKASVAKIPLLPFNYVVLEDAGAAAEKLLAQPLAIQPALRAELNSLNEALPHPTNTIRFYVFGLEK